MDKIRILQLGAVDWRTLYTIPEGIIFHYEKLYAEDAEAPKTPKTPYDLVFIDRKVSGEELTGLDEVTKAYALFVMESLEMTPAMSDFFRQKMGQRMKEEQIQDFLCKEAQDYFSKSYGEKFLFDNLAVSQDFKGSIEWNGNYSVSLQGTYGGHFHQIAYWRNNIPMFRGQTLELWLEYQKEKTVSLVLKVVQFESGSLSKIIQTLEFDETHMNQPVQIESKDVDSHIFISLRAKGKGKLHIIALHDRYSRRGKGSFIPGGERYVTSRREELFCYFEPGDFKPPLNVYFSGYKTREGFEGYNLIKSMGCPFLLISEARLEGGAFYMGSEEYEKLIADCILEYMKKLHFTPEQVVMSGLSMGTFGVLYYGCDIRPHAMILGKPLASIGDVAKNEKTLRPGGFPTSLDVLQFVCQDTDERAVAALNDKFWNKFDSSDFSKSKFIISYMIEDDYDATAYATLLEHLGSEGVQVYGKGIHGRHNDNTGAIVSWFTNQYKRTLNEDFGRRIEY